MHNLKLVTSESGDIRGFVKTLSDMELVAMQQQARQANDEKLLNLILEELGNRPTKRRQACDVSST